MAILQIDQLMKRQGNTLLLPTINLQITGGQCVVIQCNNELSNMLIQLLLGAVPASSGKVLIEGADLRHNYKQYSHKIGISLLSDGLYERLTLRDYLLFYKKLYDVTVSIDDALRRVGLWDQKSNRISTLSLSERKRLQLGRTIIHNPSLIILEEPEQNVDIETRIIIRRLIAELRNEGKAILITTSYLEDAVSITNEVYRLNEHELKKIEIIDETQPDANIEYDVPDTDQHKHVPVEAEEELLLPDPLENQTQVQEAEVISPAPVETSRPVRVEKIPAKVDDKIILFDPTEINFIESSEGVSLLHVKGATFPCTFTLSDLEDKLKAFGFFRCHRSYIVNLQKVREVITWTRNSFSLILDDDKKSSIPLSKGKFDELKAILGI
ncbi:MAG: LytTR family transcriptional regulator DNA-binding domain-containing protein [Candidatus Pristimantibacillus sp.]